LLMKILDIVEGAETGLAIPMQENVTIPAHIDSNSSASTTQPLPPFRQ
jgi:hypothetical protein